jgi:ABC-2 type transport system ATP-binding protein
MEDSSVVLQAKSLEKTFRTPKGPAVLALKGVSLEVRQGQVTGLVGADGAGKTTLIRIAAGLLKPSKGSVSVLGLDCVRDSLKVQSLAGYMPQKFGLYQDLTVQENLDLYADLQGVSSSLRQKRFDQLLTMTGLEPFATRLAGRLSGGMKQKLGLACSLVKSPRMLLLDEPTVGVDPVSRRDLWTIVYELVDREGIGILLSTAYLDEAERCTEIVVLHEGDRLDQGPPDHFHDLVQGRVALVSPSRELKPRQLQHMLADHVLDATIRSGQVRVVTRSQAMNAVTPLLPDDLRPNVIEARPTFEDAFMSLIPRRESAFQLGGLSRESVPGTGEILVRTRELGKVFGRFEAVKDLSFDVHQGEIFGLLGPNGAGKSTTFRMLCGLLSASSGEVSVAGQDLKHSRARARAHLGYMAQQFSLYTQLSVFENLRFFGRVYGLSGKTLRQRLEWAYQEFGLAPWKDRAAGALPGGTKQRLAMAAALLHEPRILFLDEPTSGVDPLARREFWLRITGFAAQGVTVVVTTHFMEESEYCDRMLIMSQGTSLAMGTPEEIRALARSDSNPEPTIDDAFIALAEGRVKADKRVEDR